MKILPTITGLSSPVYEFLAGVCALVRDFLYCDNPVLRLNIDIIIEAKTGKRKRKNEEKTHNRRQAAVEHITDLF